MQLLTMVLDSLGIVLIRSLKRPNTLRIEVNYSMINSPRKLPVQIPRLTAQIYIYICIVHHISPLESCQKAPPTVCAGKNSIIIHGVSAGGQNPSSSGDDPTAQLAQLAQLLPSLAG